MVLTTKEALLYQPLADSRVRCTACARYCNIPEGKVGLCGVRQNIGGKLQLLVYGKVITGHIDPIEKKPVVHYMPGSKIFSIATTGCNWLCPYCHNFDRKYIGIPDAQPIFQTIQEIRDRGKAHIEITDLVVPEIGDNLDEARKLSRWLYDNLGPDVPVHFLRFHPDYKLMHLPSTPVKTLEEHCRVAREEGLRYVYVGNVTGHPWEHTYCPECKNIAIKRYGFDITGWNLDDKNRCTNCGYHLPIFGQLSSSVSEDRFLPVVN